MERWIEKDRGSLEREQEWEQRAQRGRREALCDEIEAKVEGRRAA